MNWEGLKHDWAVGQEDPELKSLSAEGRYIPSSTISRHGLAGENGQDSEGV